MIFSHFSLFMHLHVYIKGNVAFKHGEAINVIFACII